MNWNTLITDYIQASGYEKRLIERHLWVKMGTTLVIGGGVLFAIAYIGDYFNSLHGYYIPMLLVSLFCIFLGFVTALILGRVGWSKHKFVDFLFNRFPILLVILGFGIDVVQAFFWGSAGYGYVVVLVGVILVLFGIRFSSPIN